MLLIKIKTYLKILFMYQIVQRYFRFLEHFQISNIEKFSQALSLLTKIFARMNCYQYLEQACFNRFFFCIIGQKYGIKPMSMQLELQAPGVSVLVFAEEQGALHSQLWKRGDSNHRTMAQISVRTVKFHYLLKYKLEFNKNSHNASSYAYSSYS